MGEGEAPPAAEAEDGPDPRLGWFERRVAAGLPKVKPDKLDKFMKGDPLGLCNLAHLSDARQHRTPLVLGMTCRHDNHDANHIYACS